MVRATDCVTDAKCIGPETLAPLYCAVWFDGFVSNWGGCDDLKERKMARRWGSYIENSGY